MYYCISTCNCRRVALDTCAYGYTRYWWYYIYPRSRSSVRVRHLDLFICLSVCLSVHVLNSKTIAQVDLIVLHKKEYTRVSVLLRDDPDLDSRIYWRILQHCEIGQNRTSKYATTSNVRCDEKRRSDVKASGGLPALIVLLHIVLIQRPMSLVDSKLTYFGADFLKH